MGTKFRKPLPLHTIYRLFSPPLKQNAETIANSIFRINNRTDNGQSMTVVTLS
jgi:hypothetical protein